MTNYSVYKDELRREGKSQNDELLFDWLTGFDYITINLKERALSTHIQSQQGLIIGEWLELYISQTPGRNDAAIFAALGGKVEVESWWFVKSFVFFAFL